MVLLIVWVLLVVLVWGLIRVCRCLVWLLRFRGCWGCLWIVRGIFCRCWRWCVRLMCVCVGGMVGGVGIFVGLVRCWLVGGCWLVVVGLVRVVRGFCRVGGCLVLQVRVVWRCGRCRCFWCGVMWCFVRLLVGVLRWVLLGSCLPQRGSGIRTATNQDSKKSQLAATNAGR